jgi:hypothetical protein
MVADSAQATFITPPPPDGNVTFDTFTIGGENSGVRAFIREVNPGETFDINGAAPGLGYTEVIILDWLPFAGVTTPLAVAPSPFTVGTIGANSWGGVEVNNTNPAAGGPFAGLDSVLTGQVHFGRLADIVLPFFGAPITANNINIPLAGIFNVPFLDFSVGTVQPANGSLIPLLGSADTFTAQTLVSISATDEGEESSIDVTFSGFWNVFNPDTGLVEQFAGNVIVGAEFAEDISAAVITARGANGNTQGYSGSANIISKVPEPSTLAGLAVIAGSAAFFRKRQKS